MKVLIFAVVALLAAARAEQCIREVAPVEFASYDYHTRFGIAEAARIMQAEMLRDPSKIVGGSAANLGQFPYQGGLLIALQNGDLSVCGCSMLSNTRAITAAHCSARAREFLVVYGSLTLFTGGVRIVTSDVQNHADYDPNTFANDISMITHAPVPYTNYIRNINLPTGSDTYAGQTAVASGYGRTSDTSIVTESQTLSHVSLQVITNEVCQQSYSNIVGSNLCASGFGGSSTCKGDSGGPLAIGSGANSILIGVVSFGAKSCQKNAAIGFSRVTSFMCWITARL